MLRREEDRWKDVPAILEYKEGADVVQKESSMLHNEMGMERGGTTAMLESPSEDLNSKKSKKRKRD